MQEVVERIWNRAEHLCGKRLAPASISAATLDRLLAECKARARRGKNGTRPGSLLRHQVPIQGEVWDEQWVGFLEADSVAHCGSSLAGDFIWSLTYTDLARTWTEGRAVWNK